MATAPEILVEHGFIAEHIDKVVSVPKKKLSPIDRVVPTKRRGAPRTDRRYRNSELQVEMSPGDDAGIRGLHSEADSLHGFVRHFAYDDLGEIRREEVVFLDQADKGRARRPYSGCHAFRSGVESAYGKEFHRVESAKRLLVHLAQGIARGTYDDQLDFLKYALAGEMSDRGCADVVASVRERDHREGGSIHVVPFCGPAFQWTRKRRAMKLETIGEARVAQ